jgi:hypothetical protein
VLQEQQQIRNVSGAALFDELPLHRQGLVVRHQTKPTDLELTHTGT